MHKKAREYFETLKWMSQVNKAVTAKDLLKANILEVQTARRAKDVLDGLVEYFGYDKILKEKNLKKWQDEYIFLVFDEFAQIFQYNSKNKDEKKLRANIDNAINSLVKLTFLKEIENGMYKIRNSVESFCDVKYLGEFDKKIDEYVSKLREKEG